MIRNWKIAMNLKRAVDLGSVSETTTEPTPPLPFLCNFVASKLKQLKNPVSGIGSIYAP
jgi:hypothetical protein